MAICCGSGGALSFANAFGLRSFLDELLVHFGWRGHLYLCVAVARTSVRSLRVLRAWSRVVVGVFC
jgi:hypothetical protein